ncbi:MAG: methyltransferase domain-containing protein [Phycisphaerales bacterium]|nr:methyltransferase domain-containing protein [Phycisphaerales bacterium]
MTTILSTPATAEPVSPVFCDRSGKKHTLVPGHRDKLKPGWRRMLQDAPPPPTDAELTSELSAMAERFDLAERVLATYCGSIAGSDVLSVGCGDIIEPIVLAGWGARRVVGTDRKLADGAEASERFAQTARDHLRSASRPTPRAEQVTLVVDDIAKSTLPNALFDLVASWRTLEHIANPRAAFAEMYRVLRPGGYCYHEYNPFFGLDGGHSLVTLDIPWGHVRFNRDDLAAYLAQFRANETMSALAYYDNCLNRMTLADLEIYARDAGFEILALIPRTRTEDLIAVDADLMSAARRNYPGVTINDLVCRIVRVVLRRPARS